MYDIVIIGGTLTGLFSSINLSNNYKVCIIDLNQEIGFPTNFPGLIENIDILDDFVKEKDKLYLKQNKSGFGLRSEWLMKYLTHNAAKNGVDILNRTRVSNIFYDDNFSIELIGAGPQNPIIFSKIIIDETERTYSAPGDKEHRISNENELIISIKEQQKEFFVGTIPFSNSKNISNYKLKIDRSDGLTEFWFENEPQLEINWIETKKCSTFSNPKFMKIDRHVEISKQIIETISNILT